VAEELRVIVLDGDDGLSRVREKLG